MAFDPLEPPKLLIDRTVHIQREKTCSITAPMDLQQSTPPRWFTTGGTPAMQPIRHNNEVLGIIDGTDTFLEMHEAILTACTSGHYICLLAWFLGGRARLNPSYPSSEVMQLFNRASGLGVQVRAMLWDQALTQNNAEVGQINALANGAAILDNRTLNLGAHHQKILIVKGAEGLEAFCGGVDINPDRVPPATGNGRPLHDVHCRIKGPGAFDLLQIFVQRWNDHPDHVNLDARKGVLLGSAETVPPAPPNGRHVVQIGRTYPNGSNHAGIGRGGYSFAPNGEQTTWRMIAEAIGKAKKFIYIEDQYLVDMRASNALVGALPNIKHLTILVPHGSLSDLPQTNYRRREFIAPLRRAGGTKVRVYFLAPAGTAHTYVHAKTWIFDDEYAIIGSANCNRRGYTHDSEAEAGIYDPATNRQLTNFFARRLRIRLWAEHLNMRTPAGEAALFDGVAASVYWLSPPPGARIGILNENDNIERLHTDAAWNNQWDPDGS
jgi:phosphatidylserine/phosphatidylglycerophosphate/cardiolipin synthase-like enzyme